MLLNHVKYLNRDNQGHPIWEAKMKMTTKWQQKSISLLLSIDKADFYSPDAIALSTVCH